jgi:hypothetical protein
MLGFKSINSADIKNSTIDIDNNSDILEINSLLKSYKDIHECFHAWVVLAIEDVDVSYKNYINN